MSTYNELKEEFDRKVKELRENCPHINCDWMEEQWVVAHSTGYEVFVCKVCDKTIDKRKKTKKINN